MNLNSTRASPPSEFLVTDPMPIPLLVASCDKYADVWPHFFELFHQRWPDCPFPVLLGSNSLSFPGVTNISIGPDSSWSTGVRHMLDRVSKIYPKAEYVLLFLEDFFLRTRVDTARIVELAAVTQDNNVGCLRLVAGLPLALHPTYEFQDAPGLGMIASGEPYRVTLQVAIWRIETLYRLLAPGLSPWEFEQIGTQMSEGLDWAFWGVMKSAIDYDHAIEKGKWKPGGLAILRDAGLEPQSLSREVFSQAELDSHYERGIAESKNSTHRDAALRSFLAGRRIEGLHHVWRCVRGGDSKFTDLVLGLVGPFGATMTKEALKAYTRLRLWSCAQRERHHS